MQDEKQLMLAKIDDIIRSVNTRSIAFTRFLSESELAAVMPHIRTCGYFYSDFGGYADAERRVVCISSFGEPTDDMFPIRTLCFKLPRFFEVGHRDVLGALMGLGIKRELVGDIVFENDCCYAFVSESIADYIKDNVTSVGRAAVSFSDSERAVSPRRELEEIPCTLSSMRLDCVVSAVLHLSRSAAEELIEDGSVYINGIEKKKKDAQLKVGDVFTVRHRGRYRVSEEAGTTKKGRLRLRIYKYI